jgi:hypothetical protein
MLDLCCLVLQEDFEDIKGVVRICKSTKDRQRNGQRKKVKRTNNDLQNIHIKLKIELHEPDQKPGCSGRVNSSCSN